jgi:hypothetical protein
VSVDSRAYARAIAEVIAEASERGIVPRELRVGSRFRLARLDSLPGAMMLIASLAATDHDAERWYAVRPLSPEVNHCVTHLRHMRRAEEYQAAAEAELAALKAKALARLADARGGAEPQASPGASARAAR